MIDDEIFAKHIQLVIAVNDAIENDDIRKEINSANILYGFRAALELMGINQLMDCDRYYLNQGIDRPMCCGVFLTRSLKNEKVGDIKNPLDIAE